MNAQDLPTKWTVFHVEGEAYPITWLFQFKTCQCLLMNSTDCTSEPLSILINNSELWKNPDELQLSGSQEHRSDAPEPVDKTAAPLQLSASLGSSSLGAVQAGQQDERTPETSQCKSSLEHPRAVLAADASIVPTSSATHSMTLKLDSTFLVLLTLFSRFCFIYMYVVLWCVV